jgi:hypothetical protein
LGILVFAGAMKIQAQDPSFSQFFSSPLNINPALTGKSTVLLSDPRVCESLGWSAAGGLAMGSY